jgi:hypothetical protein
MIENFGNVNGFRVGEYFVAFPDGEFIKEDADGKLFVLVDVYKIDPLNKAVKVDIKELPEGLDILINDEINKFLVAAIDAEKNNINK